MTIIEYKGYQASVTYEDEHLFIHVLHIEDFLSVECDCASDVEGKFENLIDEYLHDCDESGDEPDRPFKGTFNVRIGSALHREAVMVATRGDQSLNSWIASAIEQKIESDRSQKKIRVLAERISHAQRSRLATAMPRTEVVQMLSTKHIITTSLSSTNKPVNTPKPSIEDYQTQIRTRYVQ